MKRIELFWNILYYCTYALLYKCFRAIDLFRLIDNKYTRKFYKKENIFWQSLDIVKRTEEREKDLMCTPKFGLINNSDSMSSVLYRAHVV